MGLVILICKPGIIINHLNNQLPFFTDMLGVNSICRGVLQRLKYYITVRYDCEYEL